MEIQLIHHLEFMKLDGLHRDVEQASDLLGPSPFCNELQYFSLAGREGSHCRSTCLLF